MRRLFLAAAVLTLARDAAAGEKSPASAIPIGTLGPTLKEPATYGIPGVSVKSERMWRHLEAAPNLCFVDRSNGINLQTTGRIGQGGELWRFVEKDDTMKLEKIEFESDPDSIALWVKRRSSIPARPVAKANGVTVWAYREPAGEIVLLAKGATDGREFSPLKADEDGSIANAWSGCSYGAVRLWPSQARLGAIVQLRGTVDESGQKRRFVIDGSLVKTARDAEPILSLRVRRFDD